MSQKTGRNDPCPCGSGKKYKKCCLAKDEEHARATERRAPFTASEDEPDWAVDDVGGPQLTPYQMGKLAEQDRVKSQLDSRYLAKLAQRWLPSKMAALSTEEIVERLGRCGIVTSAEWFRQMAREHESAWLLAEEEWFPEAREVEGLAEDFWCFAACELWKRWLPDPPSTEMRDDLMIEGRTFSENRNRDPVRACDLWLRAWEWIRPRLTAEMRSTNDAQELIGDLECMGDWVDDFADALRYAAREDRRYAELGLRFCEQVLAHFPEDDNEFIRCQVGDFLFFLGERERGEAVFTALIGERPEESVGYARLADAHKTYVRRGSDLVTNYVCLGRGRLFGDPPRQSVLGTEIDAAVAKLLVEAVTPMALELALAVQQEIQSRIDEADRLRHRQVERAQYETDRARHRYMQVDPANRLVADALEAEWNAALRALAEAQQQYQQ